MVLNLKEVGRYPNRGLVVASQFMEGFYTMEGVGFVFMVSGDRFAKYRFHHVTRYMKDREI